MLRSGLGLLVRILARVQQFGPQPGDLHHLQQRFSTSFQENIVQIEVMLRQTATDRPSDAAPAAAKQIILAPCDTMTLLTPPGG